ncbi:hypothetical protein AC578_8141 [Pseudocercospora eumusae]|uniref:DUF7730 domain-containing protein n=1 Tax=Pseudocercospora eumusae TaxID=321146 RepID=A0A139HAH8_9PEZI|nr:hypothetical protein AC578_8141 [Pseudocercospora eumusae]
MANLALQAINAQNRDADVNRLLKLLFCGPDQDPATLDLTRLRRTLTGILDIRNEDQAASSPAVASYSNVVFYCDTGAKGPCKWGLESSINPVAFHGLHPLKCSGALEYITAADFVANHNMTGHSFFRSLRSLLPSRKSTKTGGNSWRRGPIPIESPVRALGSRQHSSLDAPAYLQDQSALIASIPVELRVVIWEYVLGPKDENDVLHLDLADGTLWHCRCFDQDRIKLGFRHFCWSSTMWFPEYRAERDHLPGEPRAGRRLLALLLSCKVIYAEAAEILYLANTFDMRRAASLIRLPQVIVPYRLQQIRSIRFSTEFECLSFTRNDPPSADDEVVTGWWRPPDRASQWYAACDTLRSLQHLERLSITLALWQLSPSNRDGPMDDDAVVAILKPLSSVHAKHYVVTLTATVSEASFEKPSASNTNQNVLATSENTADKEKTKLRQNIHFEICSDSQQQSALISRIPVELRLIIWKNALGSTNPSDVLHLDLADGILWYCQCYDSDTTKLGFRHICWRSTVWRQDDREEGDLQGRRKLLALPLSCRLIYNESIEFLYSANIFDYVRFSTAFDTSHRTWFGAHGAGEVTPSRKWFPPDEPVHWRAACQALACLDHLQDLDITLALWPISPTTGDYSVSNDAVVAVLEPLKAVHAVRFSVTLTNDFTDSARERLGALPFSVHRRERRGIGFYFYESDD